MFNIKTNYFIKSTQHANDHLPMLTRYLHGIFDIAFDIKYYIGICYVYNVLQTQQHNNIIFYGQR